MDIFAIYIAIFFAVFLVMPVTYFFLRFILWLIVERCGCCSSRNSTDNNDLNNQRQRNRNRNRNRNRSRNRQSSHPTLYYDRQGNIFTISDDASMNAGANHYADFFYLEPSADDAARIRAQLEKDEKDLPSYEDVMGMNNLSSPTAGIGPSVSTTSIATNMTTVSADLPPEVPPYSEIDPNSIMNTTGTTPAPTAAAVSTSTTTNATAGAAPSTSRAAAAAAASTTVTIIPIMNSNSASIV